MIHEPAVHVLAAGALHFGVIIASALVPRVLDWRCELARLGRLSRRVVWVHGAFVGLVIAGFGALSVLNAPALASGEPLARSVCALLAVFWGARLSLQFLLFRDETAGLSAALRAGFHGLTIVFTYLTAVYTWAALLP